MISVNKIVSFGKPGYSTMQAYRNGDAATAYTAGSKKNSRGKKWDAVEISLEKLE